MSNFLFVLLTTFTVNGVSFDMIHVEGGTFQMGATREQGADRVCMDRPVHPVAVSSFLLGQTEVTRQLYKAVMNHDAGDWIADDLPIDWVSWDDCQRFIARLDSLTGQHFRLPTEAEWEYAARGGRGAEPFRFAGSNNYEEVGWLYGNSNNHSHAVAKLRPNALGFYDMTGNVYEWCQDWYAPYKDSIQFDPQGPTSGERRVARGCSWSDSYLNAHLSFRQGFDPAYQFYNCGFRLAMDAPSEATATHLKPKDDNQLTVRIGVHKLRLQRVDGMSFYVTEEAVSQALYRKVMKRNPSEKKRPGASVNGFSMDECRRFIYMLDSITGLQFRLPGDEEWAQLLQQLNLHQPEQETVEQHQKSMTLQRKRRRKQRSQAWSEMLLRSLPVLSLVGVDASVPEDQILKYYQQNPIFYDPTQDGIWLILECR